VLGGQHQAGQPDSGGIARFSMLVHIEAALTLLSSPAGIQCTVVSTERGNHARGALEALPAEELARFDGVVAVGGDGLFQETLTALLTLRCAPLLRPCHSRPVHRVSGRCPCWPGSNVCGSACQGVRHLRRSAHA
jgi:Diacylglycerol kinase catalytic domain